MTVKNFLELVEIKAKIASVWPFLLGLIFVAFNFNHVNWDVTGVFFVAMFLFNMAVDINDNYQDYRHAGTQAERWKRETNIIGVQHLRMARVFGLMATFVVIAGVLGLWLVWITGWPLLVMGGWVFLSWVSLRWGTPTIIRHANGGIFAGFTMGYLITLITVYLNVYQRGGLSWSLAGRVLLASGIAVTAIAALLLANNICDAKEDLALKRRTIVYYLGKRGSLILFAAFYVVGYLAFVGAVAVGDLPRWSLLALLSIPLVYRNVRDFFAVQVKKQTFILAVRSLAILAGSTVLAEMIGLFFG